MAVQLGAEGLIPAELVSELAATAKLVALTHPGDATPEPGYRSSTALADYVRCRDLTCRWPGCDQPAGNCDLDHSTPYADGGPTHASNLNCKCRTHHLVKTFWGWQEKQLPDGTLIFTAPTGHTYVTTPGSALLFPALCQPASNITGDLAASQIRPESLCRQQRATMMPKRSRTRAQNRAYRINTERRRNRNIRTQNPPSQTPPDTDHDPPPF